VSDKQHYVITAEHYCGGCKESPLFPTPASETLLLLGHYAARSPVITQAIVIPDRRIVFVATYEKAR
jgi:hypothetical protein